ncbi:MAG: type I-B CRISPR-associated protein Cas7/Cst2/DevR [Nanopusillaceae archaeon]
MTEKKDKTNKTVQIAILARVYGNVNADETIGNRTTIKKFYSSEGEVLPFVSARAIKYAIREALKNEGFEIDPFVNDTKNLNDNKEQNDKKNMGNKNLNDSGDPIKYIDNDLFGYMVTIKGSRKGEGGSLSRQAPVAISYFKALKNTPIVTEFGGRFPRNKDDNPQPFEVEVADFIGRLNVLIYDYIGKFKEDELKKDQKDQLQKNRDYYELDRNKREERIKKFLEVLLTPKYVLPRRTNSLNVPEYKIAVVVLNNKGVLPVYQYLDYKEQGIVDTEKLKKLVEICKKLESRVLVIDYDNWLKENIDDIEKVDVNKAIEEITNHLL